MKTAREKWGIREPNKGGNIGKQKKKESTRNVRKLRAEKVVCTHNKVRRCFVAIRKSVKN